MDFYDTPIPEWIQDEAKREFDAFQELIKNVIGKKLQNGTVNSKDAKKLCGGTLPKDGYLKDMTFDGKNVKPSPIGRHFSVTKNTLRKESQEFANELEWMVYLYKLPT